MGLFKKKAHKLNAQEYGYFLSNIILTYTHNSFSEISDIFDDSNNTSSHFMELALHYTYICECLLKEKYPSSNVDRCIIYTIEGLVAHFNVSDSSLEKATISLLETYSTIECIKANTYTEEGLHRITQSYQDCCGIKYSLLLHVKLFTMFSDFIIHHISDIAGEHLSLV